MASGTSGPTGFEPGMFKTDEESTAKVKVEKDKEKSADGQSKVRTFNLSRIIIELSICFFKKKKIAQEEEEGQKEA